MYIHTCHTITALLPEWMPNMQEDAHELFVAMLTRLSNELQGAMRYIIIVKTYCQHEQTHLLILMSTCRGTNALEEGLKVSLRTEGIIINSGIVQCHTLLRT